MSHPTLSRVLALALLAVTLLVAPHPRPAHAAETVVNYQSAVVGANQLGLTTTNYGVLGNSFALRDASLEFPLGSGYEHLTHAGLWVGANATDAVGPFTGVVTGMNDEPLGINGAVYSEWTPMSDILQRSSLPSSPLYDPAAASELDVLSVFDDHVLQYALGHRPMGVSVRQQIYSWSQSDYGRVLFLRYVVRNQGATLNDVWVGLYTEFASGDKNAYACWPPASGCGPSPWFYKKWLSYDDSLRLVREHYCLSQPVPFNCNLAAVPPWIGLKLLTRPRSGQAVTLSAWNYWPGNPARDEDVERYALLSAGTVTNLTTPDLMPATGDPCELLALGPFASIAPGDSVTVDFALVGGNTLDSLWSAANLAQHYHDTGQFDTVVPVAASLVSAEARPDGVRLRWWSARPCRRRWSAARTARDGLRSAP